MVYMISYHIPNPSRLSSEIFFSLVIKQFDPKPMAQITKESMQEQRAIEAWLVIREFLIGQVIASTHIIGSIVYGSYCMDHVTIFNQNKHHEKMRGFKKKRDLFLKPLKGRSLSWNDKQKVVSDYATHYR